MGLPRLGERILSDGGSPVADQQRRLGDLAWPDVAGPHLLLVPTGSCEQHGPHLPLDTDTLIASALADAATEPLAARNISAVVAPAVGIGASGEHRGFPGTLSIGTPTMEAVAVEIARSALPDPADERTQFTAVLFVNGHGGNAKALTRAVTTVRSEGRRVSAWHPRVEGGDPHAGHTETSLMLYLHPDRVRMDRAEAGSTVRMHEIDSELRTGGVKAVSANGVLGDPTAASSAHGRALTGRLLVDLTAAAEDLMR